MTDKRGVKNNLGCFARSLGIGKYQASEKEAYMNPQQKQHFINILMAWKERLMQGVGNTMVHLQEEAVSYSDVLDRATQEEEMTLELRTRDRERKLLRKIGQALQDIEDDVYGYCELCGAAIGLLRLEARPTADKCIDCKTFEEVREQQNIR